MLSTIRVACSKAFEISPMPPSSPATKRPGTLLSPEADTSGSSTPRFALPRTSVIACAGQFSLQVPQPMQLAAVSMCDCPSTRPSTSP
jgi:hypothetical protein